MGPAHMHARGSAIPLSVERAAGQVRDRSRGCSAAAATRPRQCLLQDLVQSMGASLGRDCAGH